MLKFPLGIDVEERQAKALGMRLRRRAVRVAATRSVQQKNA